MVMMFIKPYVEAGDTPGVQKQIQGEDVGISEEELLTRPNYWRQKIIDDFVGWLNGKPEALRAHVKLEGFPTEVELEEMIGLPEVPTEEKIMEAERVYGENWYRILSSSELSRWFRFTKEEIAALPYEIKGR